MKKLTYLLVCLLAILVFPLHARQTSLVPFRQGNLWGYANSGKTLVLPPKYKMAQFFDGSTAIIENKEGKYVLINLQGNELSKPYDFIDKFCEDRAKVVSNGWIGFIDRSGKEVIPLQFDDDLDSYFYQGLARVSKAFHNGKRWGYINKEGQEVVPIKYFQLGKFHYGAAIFEHEKYGMGFVDNKGVEIIPADPNNKIVQAIHFGEGGRTLIKRNGVVVLIDKMGEILKTYKYDEIGWRYRDVIMVGKGGKWGFIDNEGNVVAPTMYDQDQWGDLPFREGTDLGVVSVNGRWGVINKSNQTIVPYEYEGIEVHLNGLFVAWKSAGAEFQYGVLNFDGEVLPVKYRQIVVCNNGYIFASDEYQWELFDKSGNKVGAQDFASVNAFSEGLAAVTKGLSGKYGYVNANGTTVITFKYDIGRPFKNGYALVTYRGRDGYIDKNGVEYWAD